MAQTKKQKQQKALEKLTANIAERLSKGWAATFSQRMEYNTLKRALGLSGTLDISDSPITPKEIASERISNMNIPTKEQLLQIHGSFTWFWGQDFFIETEMGNFHWKDPSYDGDNSMTLFDGNIQAFCKRMNVDFGRDKGNHTIERYCGPDFTLVIPQEI